jgi:hypothetical protein
VSESKEAYLSAFTAFGKSQDETNKLYLEALRLYEIWVADDDD